MIKIIFGLFAFVSLNVLAMPLDSIGVKTVNGKQYIMHKVTKGEGIYGISKKYGVPSADVFAANSGSDQGIKIDQVLLIPRGKSTGVASSASPVVTKPTTTTVTNAVIKKEKIYHVVTAGQTLSFIAKKYNKTIEEIKTLNNLKSTNIMLGQKLVVGETTTAVQQSTQVKQAEKLVEKVEETPEIVEEVKQETKIAQKTEAATPDNVVVVTDKVVADKNSNHPEAIVTKTYSVDDGDEISEDGVAIISTEGDLGQDRSFILHPTAKIGTIIMITNPANNNAVFARVVGNCKPGNGIILKMSKTVADKLGITEDTKVKINYAR